MSSLIEYFEALERLKASKTLRVEPPYTINKDTVALEAGRKRGSIKKSREVFSLLIKEIEVASANHVQKKAGGAIEKLQSQLADSRRASSEWRRKYEDAIGRELSLLMQVKALQTELSRSKRNQK